MELFRMDWHESEGILGMVGTGPFLVVTQGVRMNTRTLVYRINRLTTNKNGASLRCSEYLGKDGDVKALAHFDLEGKYFSSGLPEAIVRDGEIGWTSDRDGDDFVSVKLNFSKQQCEDLLASLEAIPELKQPPINEDGVSTLRGWQLHVEVQELTGLSVKEGLHQHWEAAEIISISLVPMSDERFIHRERVRVSSDLIWEKIGLKFQKPEEKKALTGDEGRAYLDKLLEGKSISRNQRRRNEKARAANAEGDTPPVVKRLEF